MRESWASFDCRLVKLTRSSCLPAMNERDFGRAKHFQDFHVCRPMVCMQSSRATSGFQCILSTAASMLHPGHSLLWRSADHRTCVLGESQLKSGCIDVLVKTLSREAMSKPAFSPRPLTMNLRCVQQQQNLLSVWRTAAIWTTCPVTTRPG